MSLEGGARDNICTRLAMLGVPIAVAVSTALAQIMMAVIVYQHSWSGMWTSLRTPGDIGIYNLAFTNKTLSADAYGDVCGEYSGYSIYKGAAAQVVMPDHVNEYDGILYYVKRPNWSWDVRQLGPSLSNLDEVRYVIEEGLFG